MNNKTVIEFGFRIIWKIMEISVGVIRLGHTLRDLHNSLDDTQPHSIQHLFQFLTIILILYFCCKPLLSSERKNIVRSLLFIL